MILRHKLLIASLTLFSLSAPVSAASVYVLALDLASDDQQFGTIDLTNGAFQQIRTGAAEEYRGLVPASNGSLLTLGFDGNLTSINPATGATSVIEPTGLSNCSTPTSPCGPRSPGMLAELGGALYATDFSQNLYRVNPATGAATLIGATGIPAVPFPSHFTSNPDGSPNVFEQVLFSANGNLYATFDTNRIDPTTGATIHSIPNNLYRIDPNTGVATLVGPTTQTITAVTQVNGTAYAFVIETAQLETLNLTNGQTSVLTGVNPNAANFWYVEGATPTPEPISITLTGIGIAGVIACRLRKRGRDLNRS